MSWSFQTTGPASETLSTTESQPRAQCEVWGKLAPPLGLGGLRHEGGHPIRSGSGVPASQECCLCPLSPAASPWAPVGHGALRPIAPATRHCRCLTSASGLISVLSPRSDPGTQQALSRGLVSKCRKYPRNPELLRVAPVIARLPSPPYSLLLEDRAGSGTRKQPAGPPCNETPLCVEKHKALIHTTNG